MISGGTFTIIAAWSIAVVILLVVAWLNHPFGKK